MRTALAGFSHETNTFSSVPATYERFQVLRGDEIPRRHENAHSSLTGLIEVGRERAMGLVPLLHASTGPIGMISKDAFDRIVGEMLAMIRDQGPWDAVLLANHGAAVSEEYPDVDGEIAARVRAIVGPRVPIGMAMDLHGNITQRMIEQATVVTFYRENPHVDARERARECAEIVHRTVVGEVRPAMALETPPLVINIVKQHTGSEPLKSLMAECEAVIRRPGMLSASVIQGYPYADVPEMGMGFLAVADGDPALAREMARHLARRAWEMREQFVGHTPSPREALARAAQAERGPVVLMDVGDNIGGGSTADSTFLLAEAQRMGVRSYLQTLYDPEAVQACARAGVGAELTLKVGGKTDDRHGEPVEVTGHVRVLGDGKFEELKPIHGGGRYSDQGLTAVLDTTDGHTLVLTSRRAGNTSIQQMYSVGVQPERYKVVVAKGVQSPRPAYEPIAAEIVLVNTPGVTSSDLSSFEYKRRRRPLFPFEREATYP
ncbi:MAG TPA: M81 family metallopeptidase [Chloroflexota bacterium]|nr:M81 family metallopeptidase [Chloroflexota bacterium]